MPAHGKPRQPVSCENCRDRKIKCGGGPAPCTSCVRRGFVHSCRFKRAQCDQPTRMLGSTEYRNLSDKIDYLEALLRQHVGNESLDSRESNGHGTLHVSRPAASGRANHRGHLQLTQMGHVRFIPHHSAPDSSCLSAFLDGENDNPSSEAHDFPFSADLSLQKNALLDLLPPKRHCGELIAIYFNVFSPLFHMLHDPTFRIEYQQFTDSPSQVPLAFLAQMFVMLSIATTALKSEDSLLDDLSREGSTLEKIKYTASRYRSAAMKCLAADNFLWRHNLYTVKTLVLLLYALSHTDGPSWPLLGTTVNIAIAIGCHVDPETLDLGAVETEERRRCWAGLMMLHQIQSTCLQMPFPTSFSANVQLPADMNDDEITAHGSPFSTASEEIRCRRPTQMSYLLYKFRLYKIAAELCNADSTNDSIHEQSLLQIDSRIAEEEQQHVQRFDDLTGLPPYHQAHRHILRNYTNHLFLLLHRNSLSNNETCGSSSAHIREHSLSRCRNAATKILESFSVLCREASFEPYRWYVRGLGSFHAFLASSTLLTLACLREELTHGMSLDYLNHVEACITLFEAMSESNVCSRAGPILRRMLERTYVELRQQDFPISTQPSSINSDEVHESEAGRLYAAYNGVSGNNEEATMNSAIDLNGWDMSTDIGAFISQIPTEQWLAPYAFPWYTD